MNIKSTIVLRPGSADRVVAGHPWIYRGAILNTTHEPKDGEVVQVRDHRRRFLGIGLYNSQSKITVRVLSRTRQEIDTDFFFRRIKAAQTLRTKLLPNANSYRLVSAEGDELSGLIIDKYEDVCSVQISSLGMEQRKSQIYEALNQVCSPSAIVERKDFASRKAEGLETPDSSLKIAEPVGPVTEKTIKVNDLDFNVNFQSGHKTGFYLDQQVNYRLATDLIEKWDSKRILDCFTYQGGFAIHLATYLIGSKRPRTPPAQTHQTTNTTRSFSIPLLLQEIEARSETLFEATRKSIYVPSDYSRREDSCFHTVAPTTSTRECSKK